jgi:hypothetical protein
MIEMGIDVFQGTDQIRSGTGLRVFTRHNLKQFVYAPRRDVSGDRGVQYTLNGA